MQFKPMSEEARLKALEGEQDILTPLVEADEDIYKSSSCPWCKSSGCSKEFDPQLYLAGDRPVPKYNLRCGDCNCLFSPFSGMVLEIGNTAK